jgi:hypothetical protein
MSNPSKLDAIRNPQGIWINSKMFSPEAIHFKKYGYYCKDPWGTPDWRAYWEEQTRRCIEGYEVGGARITGHHYHYLNFCNIKKVTIIGENIAEKEVGFPDFWDGDYNYFWCLDIARYGMKVLFPDLEPVKALEGLGLSTKISHDDLEGGRHMIVGKSRRKGYSYKNASILTNTYSTKRNSLSIVGAFLKDYLYPQGTMQMATNYLNFLNEQTGFRKSRHYKDLVDHKRASYKQIIDGVPIEKGFLSEIKAITFKDNPDAARGKDAAYVLFEEAGKFPNLQASYIATEPTLRSGKFITGQIVIFGTGGDMESGTVDFANMFYNPEMFKLLQFQNIWDDEAEESTCGFFHPIYWNNDGFYDENGNSDKEEALKYELKERDIIMRGSSGGSVLQSHVQEYCIKPSEAFLTVSRNNLPVVELRHRLEKVLREKTYLTLGQAGTLYRDEIGKVKFKPDLNNTLKPIWRRLPDTNDVRGAVVIYEYPIDNAPKGLYKIGYDPVSLDEGTSMASIFVYKGTHKYSYNRNMIVAEYTGRFEKADDINRIFEMLCELYNTQGMYENMVLHVKSYFAKRKKLHLLAAQPDQVISKNIKDSGVRRVYGCHMDDRLKDAGETYIKDWLLTERDTDEEGQVVTNIDMINSPGLLEELIMYNKKGNFDRVMALMMVMIQMEEEDLGKEYEDNNLNKTLTEDFERMKRFYSR